MTPAPIGLTLATYVAFPNATTVSFTHHTVRLVVLLALVAGALGFSQFGVAERAPATDIHGVA